MVDMTKWWPRTRSSTVTTAESQRKALTSDTPRRESSSASKSNLIERSRTGLSSSDTATKASCSLPASRKEVKNVEMTVVPLTDEDPSMEKKKTAQAEEASLSVQGGSVVEDLTHKKIGWLKAAFILIAETISLGILSLPAAVAKLGLVVGSIMICVFFVLTLSAGFMLYNLKLQYPKLNGFADAAKMIGGSVAGRIVETLNLLLLVFVMACHVALFAKMEETVAGENLWKCSVVFKVIGLAVCLPPTLFRTLKAQSFFSFISSGSILLAVAVAIISIGLQKPGKRVFSVLPPIDTDFAIWSLACSNILVSFAGHLAYFKVMEEMEKPKDFWKSLSAAGVVMFTLYLCTGVIVYYFAGPNVAGIALSSASPKIAMAAYTLAGPTIIVAGVLAAYLACKRVEAIFWQFRKMPAVANEISTRAWTCWIVIVVSLWSVAFVLANVLPFFGTLLGLIGAIAATWISIGLPAWYCLFMIRERSRERQLQVDREELEKEGFFACFRFPTGAEGKVGALWGFCLFLLVVCCFFAGIGLYGSVVAIMKQTKGGEGFYPFSCRFSSS